MKFSKSYMDITLQMGVYWNVILIPIRTMIWIPGVDTGALKTWFTVIGITMYSSKTLIRQLGLLYDTSIF